MNFKSIKDVESHAKQLMTKEYKVDVNGKTHLLTPIKLGYGFKFDNAKRRFGYCSYRDKEISLSKPLCEYIPLNIPPIPLRLDTNFLPKPSSNLLECSTILFKSDSVKLITSPFFLIFYLNLHLIS